MRPRLFTFVGFVLAQSGCAFFGVEPVDCLEEPCSEESGGNGDGDGDVIVDDGGSGGGDGDGDAEGSGGDDGDGGDTGGSDGSGGDPGGAGGSGGTTGGTGGSNGGGGTGGDGDPSGGSDGTGGAPTGGTGGNGTGGSEADALSRELMINEVWQDFVEIYFRMYSLTSVSLDGFSIVIDNEFATACELDGFVLDADNQFLLAQADSEPCQNELPRCVAGCALSIQHGTTVRLYKVGIDDPIDEVTLPPSGTLDATHSYATSMDGDEGSFDSRPRSAGVSNNP